MIEGANLFFTQEARLKLEDAGLVVIKDARYVYLCVRGNEGVDLHRRYESISLQI